MLYTVMDIKTINKGRQLKFSRVYRGFSQIELCDKVNGLSQSNLSKFEKGFNCISEKKLIEIMKVLTWNIEWLEVRTPQHHYCI